MRLFQVRPLVILCLAVAAYMLIMPAVTSYMTTKPLAEKLGAVPNGKVLRYLVADYKEITAAGITLKVLYYFGSIVEKTRRHVDLPTDYPAISRSLHAAVAVDPYNMDAYYFGQAVLVWDVGKVEIANQLLEHGMKFRTWDWYLPFFAGFNHGYFLRDSENAARYYRKAAELTGSELFSSLAGKYYLQAGKTDHAITYLTMMMKGATNTAVRDAYAKRLKGFKEIRRIEQARDRFKTETGRLPRGIQELLKEGSLETVPVDPYGGRFYFDSGGNVVSTSKGYQIFRSDEAVAR